MPLRFCKGIQWTVTDLVWDRSGIGYEERRLCTGANTDEGCGTRPLNNTHTYIQPRADQELSSLTSLLWSSERERERERDKIRQKKWGRVHETVDSESLWMPVVSDRGMMVLGKHHGAFLCVLMAWAGAHTVLCVSPPLLLCSLPFIPLFPANGCVFWTPLFCRRPLLHFIKPPGF